MWCSNCRQDVPALGSALEAGLFCARCQVALGGELPTVENASASAGEVQSGLGPIPGGEWDDIDDMLSRADWLLNRTADSAHAPPRFSQLDTAQPLVGWHLRPTRPLRVYRPPSRTAIVSWFSLGMALTGFVCGCVLLCWSLFGDRPDLWNIGETVTLASQVGLLIGLVLQLDRIGQDRRQTAERLTRLDQRVDSLHAVAAPGNPGPPAPNFVAHVNRAAAAEEDLLADLQSQLDQLASKLRDRRTA